MPFTVTMPKLSPTMETGVIAKWHKKEGDKVASGDLLLEVSTDKATVEHTALDEGFLRKILVKEGGSAAVNEPIAVFTEKFNEDIANYVPEGETAAPVKTAGKETAVVNNPVPAETKESRVVASPLAKKLAKEHGIDLSSVSGSGPRGRIVSKDLEKTKPVRSQTKEIPAIPHGTFEELSLTPIRKVISDRLQVAKSTIPHFYVQQAVNAENLINFREQLSHLGTKVSVNDCIIRACALALRDHPVVNSGFNAAKNTLIRFKTVDISVAVSIPDGLITPIVRHADYKNLSEISEEVRALAKKAKEGKLAPAEFQGGSFTISNMGMFGVTDFQAIINPPQAAILAVSGIQDIPVVKNNAVVPGKVMNITLSVDHRVVDGVAAAEFIKTVQKYLENPIALML